jgi:MFS superfamily sulfate permease-like transporter
MKTSTIADSTPPDGVAGLRAHWKSDLVSGFLVSLIALPLCLGIAMASGFPPTAGIISAIVGGLLVSRINGSHVTINGPAAGLIVVILAAVQTLGQGDAMQGYRCTLAAIVVASALQMALGLFKAGRLNAYFPPSVVHGMLAAIGVIIMAKQIHVMVGVKPEAADLLATIAAIPRSLLDPNPEIALIGSVGLGILIAWSLLRNRHLKKVPAPLLVVIAGMALGKYFAVGPEFLVIIPEDFTAAFYFPDFSKVWTAGFWGAVISICLVGSLETLLSAVAVDKLDPYKRYSDLNRDLTAVGAGNLVCGMIGGLPMIAEIVRSSANINNGAKTGWANFFHGAFLLLFVALFPRLIHQIPLASLAALLVYTGFHLASPKEFAKTKDIGWEQLAVFVITILGILATDLLVGVAIGILAYLVIHMLRGVPPKHLLKISYRIEEHPAGTFVIHIDGSAVFSNFIALKSEVADFPIGKTVIFDLSNAAFIDHTVMEFVDHFRRDYAQRGGQCEIRGLESHVPYSNHPLAARKRKSQAKGAGKAGLDRQAG